jgi:hypothetical protein
MWRRAGVLVSVVVIGTAALPEPGIGADSVLDDAVTTHFDNATETWTVASSTGRECHRPGGWWTSGLRPTRSWPLDGVPNYFRIPGPDVRQARYVRRCLE